jgi:hypothetical protein
MKNELTVILPCAGEGSRMGLKAPKELFEILPEHNGTGLKLIDYSLAHIRAFPYIEKLIVAVVIRPHKQEVAEYAALQLPGITVESLMFDDAYQEWPGSVYSAHSLFCENNLVLLPDSYLSLSGNSTFTNVCTTGPDGNSLIDLMTEALNRYSVVFGSVSCASADILKTMGAMRVEKQRVTAFQDKPLQGTERFNSFWGCYGFRKEMGRPLYDFLLRSVRHQPVSLTEQPFHPAGAFPIARYHDLGTWERVNSFINSFK